MTAALYSLRDNKSVLILEKDSFGGQIARSPLVENYPSIKSQSGLDFANNLFEQITDLGAEFELEDVEKIEKEGEIFKVFTNYGVHESKVVFIATGVEHRKFGFENEEQLVGHGVSFCATCDGAFFKDEDVIVIGDANTALQYAILLASYCNSVKVLTLFDKFFADDCLVEKLKNNPKISYEHNLSLQSYNGIEELESLTFKDTKTNELKTYKCKGCFVCIGQVPDNEKFSNLVDLEKGFIKVDENMETKTPGLYAIGDCRAKKVRQVVTAINDGAIAAVNSLKY